MKLSVIETGFFKLDGGAMYGVVPKTMWEHLNPPDENNLCTWAMRCLLIEHGAQKILIDTGFGNKQSDKFRSHFQPHGNESLLDSLSRANCHPEEITDVIITHFHFDHVGGAVYKTETGELKPQFPKANYWSNKVHYDWAMDPNPREKASFLQENFVPLKEAGQLKFIDVEDGVAFNDIIDIRFVYGHTEAMMIPEIKFEDGSKLVYMADLLPSASHIRMPYVMAYDIRPLVTLEERKKFYAEYSNDQTSVFFEHDKDIISGKINKNERGRFEIIQDESGRLV